MHNSASPFGIYLVSRHDVQCRQVVNRARGYIQKCEGLPIFQGDMTKGLDAPRAPNSIILYLRAYSRKGINPHWSSLGIGCPQSRLRGKLDSWILELWRKRSCELIVIEVCDCAKLKSKIWGFFLNILWTCHRLGIEEKMDEKLLLEG